MSVRPPVVTLFAIVLASQTSVASAQSLDLGGLLGGLRGAVGTLTSSSTVADRVTILQDVTNGLIGPTGVLSTVGAAVDAQANLLNLQANNLVSLRSDLTLLRTSTDTVSVDLSDLRTTVTRHETRLDTQSDSLNVQADLLAALDLRQSEQGRRVAALDVRQSEQGRRVATLETTSLQQSSAIDRLSRSDQAQDDRLLDHDQRIALQERSTNGLYEGMSQLSQQISQVDRKADVATEGVAIALALKSPAVADGKTFAVSGGWGTFEGHNAFAVSGAVRANSALQFDAGVAVGTQNSTVGGRAGATISW